MESQAPGNRTSVNEFSYFNSNKLSSLSHTQKRFWLFAFPPSYPDAGLRFLPPLTSLLACQICLSSSAGIILPLGDTDLRHSGMFSHEQTLVLLFKKHEFPPPPTRLPDPVPITFHLFPQSKHSLYQSLERRLLSS